MTGKENKMVLLFWLIIELKILLFGYGIEVRYNNYYVIKPSTHVILLWIRVGSSFHAFGSFNLVSMLDHLGSKLSRKYFII